MVVEAGMEGGTRGGTEIQSPGPRITAGKLIAAGSYRIEIQSRGAMSREQGDIMLKARRDAAMKVADTLFAAEDAIDAAFARVAELNSALVIARSDAQLSAIVAQDAFEMAASTLSALAKARGEIVETHKRLTEAKDQIGLRTVAIGDLGKPSAVPPVAREDFRHLQVVA